MSRTTLIVALTLSSLCLAGIPEAKSKDTRKVVPFAGLLQDENLNPISGVFPIRFSLYKTEGSRRAVWNEKLWVSVDGGRYAVTLGEDKRIPRTLELDQLYIGVQLEGVGEILREKLTPAPPVAVESVIAPAPPANVPVQTNTPRTVKSPTDIAERAMHAFEADHAINADKLGNLTVSDLKKMFAPGKVTTGSRTRETEQAGGPGGKLYELECPKGYVVTGVRGGSGKYLDSISLICTPLELN